MVYLQQLKRDAEFKIRYVKGVPFVTRGYTKGVPFLSKMVQGCNIRAIVLEVPLMYGIVAVVSGPELV